MHDQASDTGWVEVGDDVLMIPRPDGTPYLHIWLDHVSKRTCVTFSSTDFKVMWDSKMNSHIATALAKLSSDSDRGNSTNDDHLKNATTITVSGPGIAINLEYYLILKALEEAGFVVEQDNPHPKEDPNSYVNSLLVEIINKRLGMLKVRLIAKHYP